LIYGKTSCMTLMKNRLPEKKQRMDMSLSFEHGNYILFASHYSLFLLFHAMPMEPLNVVQWISKLYQLTWQHYTIQLGGGGFIHNFFFILGILCWGGGIHTQYVNHKIWGFHG
jgi:hypothetical protein